jgi:hypothetical protein
MGTLSDADASVALAAALLEVLYPYVLAVSGGERRASSAAAASLLGQTDEQIGWGMMGVRPCSPVYQNYWMHERTLSNLAMLLLTSPPSRNYWRWG